jgi:hypothetical protein
MIYRIKDGKIPVAPLAKGRTGDGSTDSWGARGALRKTEGKNPSFSPSTKGDPLKNPGGRKKVKSNNVDYLSINDQ